MWGLIARHTAIAIGLAVVLEELGLPMPIPTGQLIVTAGATGSRTWTSFAWWFIILSLASATGASGLYAIVRRGGRPLIERFGRFMATRHSWSTKERRRQPLQVVYRKNVVTLRWTDGDTAANG
jgi:membrane protein DedA with SNARE-associated domain